MDSISPQATNSVRWLEIAGGVVAAIVLILAAGAIIKRLLIAILGLFDRFK